MTKSAPSSGASLETTAAPEPYSGGVSEVAIRAALELRRRRVEGGLRYFVPQAQQVPVLEARCKGKFVLGGNRSGKTVIGAVDAVRIALGQVPGRVAARLIWCVSQELPGQAATRGEPDRPHTQLEELRKWIPKD